ncbi:hypothetical protein ACFL0U_00895 [Pseudomonadota bacterium]
MRKIFNFHLLLFILYTNHVYSAAWTKKKGEAELIGLYTFSTNKPKALINREKDEKISYYDKEERRIYLEWGITNNLTSGFSIENNEITVVNLLDDVELGNAKNNIRSVLTIGDFESIINNDFGSISTDSDYLLSKIEDFMDSIGMTKKEFLASTADEKQKIYDELLDFLTTHEKRKINQDYSLVKIFLRQKVLGLKRFVVSFQPTLQLPLYNPDDVAEKINFVNTKNAYELRLSSGYTFEYKNEKSIFNQNHFINFEAAYNKIIDSFFDEIKLDFTAGIRTNQDSFLLFEASRTYNNCSTSKYSLNNPFKKADSKCYKDAGQQVYGIRPRNNYFLKTENVKIKFSSIIRFSNTLSTQLSLMQIYTKFDTSSGIELGFWLNI